MHCTTVFLIKFQRNIYNIQYYTSKQISQLATSILSILEVSIPKETEIAMQKVFNLTKIN